MQMFPCEKLLNFRCPGERKGRWTKLWPGFFGGETVRGKGWEACIGFNFNSSEDLLTSVPSPPAQVNVGSQARS